MPFKATSTWFNLPLKSNPVSLTVRLGQNIQRVKSLRDRKCGTERQSEKVCLRTSFPSIFYPRIQDIERKRETEEAVEREDNRRIGKKYKAGFGNSPLGRRLLQQVCLMQL